MMNLKETFKKTLKIYSPSRKEKEMAVFLENLISQIGGKGYIDQAGNTIGEFGQGEKTIALLGHMDTVPGEIKVQADKEKIYGRGSVDAKGCLIAFLYSLQNLPEEILAQKRFIFIAAVEEEIYTSKGAQFVKNKFQPDFCVIGEPSSWRGITLGYRGTLNLILNKQEEQKHSGRPEKDLGLDIIEKIGKISRYIDSQKEKGSVFHSPSLEIRQFEINSHDPFIKKVQTNLVFRVPPKFSLAELENFLSQTFPHSKLNIKQAFPAYLGKRSNRLVACFNQAIRSLKGSTTYKKKTGSSDMNVVAPQWQIPMIAYGPGDSNLDHTPHEHLYWEELEKSIQVLQKVWQII